MKTLTLGLIFAVGTLFAQGVAVPPPTTNPAPAPAKKQEGKKQVKKEQKSTEKK